MTGPSRVRRHRTVLLLALVLLLAGTASVLLGSQSTPYSADLDPDNPDPNGGRAVARVLAGQGVQVQVARSAAELDDAAPDDDTTVVVTGADGLGRSTAGRLLEQAGAARLLVVEPGPAVVDALGYRVASFEVTPEGARPARCADRLLTGLDVEVDAATAYTGGRRSCFPVEDAGTALYVDVGDDVSLLGAGSVLANERVTRADNAAVALRLLGQDGRLVWYIPDPADLGAADSLSVRALLPRWLEPALWLGLASLVALVLWRGRRLGPLLTEPLPVLVRAVETTRSRGRLYRKVDDRGHAVGVLRAAARDRLATRLRLPPSAADDLDLLVGALHQRSDRDVRELRELLARDGPVPEDDHQLIRLARALAELDREVTHHDD